VTKLSGSFSWAKCADNLSSGDGLADMPLGVVGYVDGEAAYRAAKIVSAYGARLFEERGIDAKIFHASDAFGKRTRQFFEDFGARCVGGGLGFQCFELRSG
jgi:hypothetical protein